MATDREDVRADSNREYAASMDGEAAAADGDYGDDEYLRLEAAEASRAREEMGTSTEHTPLSVLLHMAMNVMIGLPFFVVGIYGLTDPDMDMSAPFIVAMCVGALLFVIGIYCSVVSRPRLSLARGEEIKALRHPSMRTAFARIALSIPFLVAAGYLLVLTQLPYVFPLVVFAAGLYMYFRGVAKYWITRFTVYYVTNQRVSHVYRFFSLDVKEIPLGSINSIGESRSLMETITGRGNVLVSSGATSLHRVEIREINNPGPVAQIIRNLRG